MKRQYLLLAALTLVVVAAYYGREHFGPTNDINLGMNPVPIGATRERVPCGDQTRAEPGQCSLDAQNGPYRVVPF
jgi:hypothetical protein